MLRHLLVLVAVFVCLVSAFADPVTLVADGEARAVICTGPEPSETVALAARELATYLGKMSGADVQVVETVADVQGAILLGARAVGAHAPGIDVSGIGYEGSVIRTLDGNRLIVAGWTDTGTRNAAYDLLELLGVHWFMPGEFGEHVPNMPTITVAEIEGVFVPSFGYRRIRAATNRLPAKEREEFPDWQRRNHMPGWLTGSTGHAYERIVSSRDDALFAEHPDYFSLIGGERRRNSQLCTTNPEVRERARAYARAYFTENPDAMMVSMSPNDGYNWCECESCKAEGSMTDNALALANCVAEVVAEKFPDKYVAMYAYAPTGPPPSIQAHERVIIWIADGFFQKGWTRESLWEGGAGKCNLIGDRDYYSVCPWTWQMPRYDVEITAADLRYFHDTRTIGVSAESEDNFGSFGVDYWIAARLMYDLDQDVDELLDEYFTCAYGAAAPAVRSYWERWGDGRGVSTDRLAMALRDLRQADALAAGDEPVLERIRALKTYIHYLRLYREFGSAAGDEKLGRFGAMIRHGYAALRYHQVMIPNVLNRLTVEAGSSELHVPAETIAEWKATRPSATSRLPSTSPQTCRHSCRWASCAASSPRTSWLSAASCRAPPVRRPIAAPATRSS